MNAKTKKTILTILKNILAWIFSLIMLIPLLLIVINAFKPDSEALTLSLTLPKIWEFSNFAVVIEKGKLGTSFLNSLLYAGCATVITVSLHPWQPMYLPEDGEKLTTDCICTWFWVL